MGKFPSGFCFALFDPKAAVAVAEHIICNG